MYSCFSISKLHEIFDVQLSLYSGFGADVKNQLLVMRSLANTFSKLFGAQFMLSEQKWVRLSELCDVTLILVCELLCSFDC